MRKHGIDMYERGSNVAFSNMSFYVLSLAPRFLEQLLQRFELMMRLRTREAYESFWGFVYHMFFNPAEISPGPQVQKMIRDTIVCFMGGQERLGPDHLLGQPEHFTQIIQPSEAIGLNRMDLRGLLSASRFDLVHLQVLADWLHYSQSGTTELGREGTIA